MASANMPLGILYVKPTALYWYYYKEHNTTNCPFTLAITLLYFYSKEIKIYHKRTYTLMLIEVLFIMLTLGNN